MNKEVAKQIVQSLDTIAEEIGDLCYKLEGNINIYSTGKDALLSGGKFATDMSRHLQTVIENVEGDELPIDISGYVVQCEMLNTIGKTLLTMIRPELEEVIKMTNGGNEDHE